MLISVAITKRSIRSPADKVDRGITDSRKLDWGDKFQKRCLGFNVLAGFLRG